MSSNPLPNKLSARIRLAVEDVQKCEADRRYVVDMSVWHTPSIKDGRPVCVVCLGGAVMAQTLKVSDLVWLTPSSVCDEFECGLSEDDRETLTADLRELDDVRGGMFGGNENVPNNLVDRLEALIDEHYDEESGHAPWPIYIQAADILEAAGC